MRVYLLDTATWAVSSQEMQDHFGAKCANWLAMWLSISFPISLTQGGQNLGTRLRRLVTSGWKSKFRRLRSDPLNPKFESQKSALL